jgi:cyclophilin family peptidyl-prolyl cis-trans isomerase
MKRLLVLLPFGLLWAGCAAPSAVNADNTATNQPAAPAAAPAPADNDSGYKVVDEAQPGMPAFVQSALKKAALPPPPASFKVPDSPKVKLTTTKGDIILQLDEKAAPLHVKSFLYLVSKGFYDGTVFHRHADLLGNGKGFIIQGGDPLTKDPRTIPFAGSGGPGYQIPREHNDLKHDQLVIAAARTQDPNSAGSQFYITQGPVYFLDQGDGYTVFGKVITTKDKKISDEPAMKLTQNDRITKAEVIK